jgi:hypothetical protein
MTVAEEWSGSPEQADDMTVIAARLGGGSVSGYPVIRPESMASAEITSYKPT